jgi:hypothetical protein
VSFRDLKCTCSPGKFYYKGSGITKEMAFNNPELAASMGVLVDMPGKSWNCERCAEVHKIKLKNELKQGIEAFWADGWLTYTITVTSSLKMTLQHWREAWHRWLTSLKLWLHRAGIRDIQIEWTKEYGKENGMRHVHGFLAYKPAEGKRIKNQTLKDRISELWYEATDGQAFITKAKQLLQRNGMKSVYYAIKYVAKQESQKLFKKRERRYFFSRGWPRTPKKPGNSAWEAIIYPRGAEMVRLEIQKIAPEIRKSWLQKSRRKGKVRARLALYGEKWKDAYNYHLEDYTE